MSLPYCPVAVHDNLPYHGVTVSVGGIVTYIGWSDV